MMPIGTQLNVFAKFRLFREALGYIPHPKQREIHLSDARFKCVAAGARSGKSVFGGAEGAVELLLPGRHIWYCSSVFELADKEFDWTIEFLSRYEIEPGKRAIDVMRLSNPSRGSRSIRTPWGSWAETKSAQKPETLLGEELDLLILGEASQLPRSAWNRQLYPRLGPRAGRALALSTPNWDSGFFRDLYDHGLSDEEDWREYAAWQFSVLANPTFDVAEYHKAKKTLDDKVFAEQYDGEFTSRRGRVFPGFDVAHIFSEMPKGISDWPIFRGVYHEKNSYNNPFSCVWVAVHPELRDFWVIDEIYERQCLPSDQAKEIRRRSEGKRVVTTIADYFNPALQETLTNAGISVTTCDEQKYNKRHATVRRIQALQTQLKIVDGFPKLHVYAGCKNLIEEMGKCKWPTPRSEESEMAEQEMPTTKFMSLPSALGFVIAYAMIAQYGPAWVYEAQGLRGVA